MIMCVSIGDAALLTNCMTLNAACIVLLGKLQFYQFFLLGGQISESFSRTCCGSFRGEVNVGQSCLGLLTVDQLCPERLTFLGPVS